MEPKLVVHKPIPKGIKVDKEFCQKWIVEGVTKRKIKRRNPCFIGVDGFIKTRKSATLKGIKRLIGVATSDSDSGGRVLMDASIKTIRTLSIVKLALKKAKI